MTIRELRDIVNQLPEDISLELPVLVRGYEGGFKDLQPSYIAVRQVCFNYRDDSWQGPHELEEDSYFIDDEDQANYRFGPALIINRSRF